MRDPWRYGTVVASCKELIVYYLIRRRKRKKVKVGVTKLYKEKCF